MILYVSNCTHDATTTPSSFKHWFSKPASLSHLQVFGCHAFTLDHCDSRSKLGSQACAAIYLSPASKHNHTHHLLLNDTGKVIVTHNVIFQEAILPAKHLTIINMPIDMAQWFVKPPKVKPYKMPAMPHIIHKAKVTGQTSLWT